MEGSWTVIGQEHKQILIKYGGSYVRVHSCRVIHYDSQNNVRPDASDNDEYLGNDNMDSSGSQKDQVDQNKSKEQSREDGESDNALSFSDSDDEAVDTIQSSINSCLSNHLRKNSSDKVQSHSQKVQGSQKNKSVLLPRPNDVVSYIPVGEETWHKAVIISKAGKSTGRNKFYLNIKDYDEDRPKCIDWENGVKTWKPSTENKIVEEEILITKKVESRGDIVAAKLRELENWSANEVFTEVVDYGQWKISARWVISEKLWNGSKVTKARLVARGFEEEDLNTLKTDSPT